MATSLIYRIMLLALLPAAAAAIYINGQRYDPALIKFKPLSEDAVSINFPREIEGFIMAGKRAYITRKISMNISTAMQNILLEQALSASL